MPRNVLAACLLLAFAPSVASAQQAMSPEKRALIKELIEVTEATKNAADIKNAIYAQQEKVMPEALARAITSDERFTPAEREAVKKALTASMTETMARLRVALEQKVDFGRIVEDVSYVVYDRHYTEGELRDLIAFYRTPTGRKTINIMPKLFADSMQMTVEVMTPKLVDVIEKFMEEEKERLRRERQPPPPPARRARRPVG